MKAKKNEVLIILAFIVSVLGFLLTIYYLFIAENINRLVFFVSSVVNVFIIIFLVWHLVKNKKGDN